MGLSFENTRIEGVKLVRSQQIKDERGSFARLYCPNAFQEAGIEFTSTQVNLSQNTSIHTLRGMHFQNPPYAESKLVRVTQGTIYDVALDLRPQSPSYKLWQGFELSSNTPEALFLPEGIAHGFLTLTANAQVLYQMGRSYVPGQAQGVRYDDPAFGIEWPCEPAIISEQDKNWPLFKA